MKKFLSIVLTAVMLLAAGSCQNDGNIGRLFGTWCLNYYSVNGERVETITVAEYTIPVDNITFSFQNNIVNVITVYDNYQTYYSSFGTWSEEGDVFTLDFTHKDADTEDGKGRYQAPVWIGMISDTKMEMNVSDSKSRSFTLTWTDPQGNVMVYKLHKTW